MPMPVPRPAAKPAKADSAPLLEGFAPILGARPRVLVLGSMPSVASLAAQGYYAHPRNRFWPLLAHLLGRDLPAEYAQREALARDGGVAIWDVLARCRRRGSLDSAIDPQDRETNAIPELIQAQPTLRLIALNGGMAAQVFRRELAPRLPAEAPAAIALPSTSPANARMDLAALALAWQPVAEALGAE